MRLSSSGQKIISVIVFFYVFYFVLFFFYFLFIYFYVLNISYIKNMFKRDLPEIVFSEIYATFFLFRFCKIYTDLYYNYRIDFCALFSEMEKSSSGQKTK